MRPSPESRRWRTINWRVRGEIDQLGGSDRDLTDRIQSTTRSSRVLAVQTYIAGGPISTLDYLLDAADAGDLTWRRFMLHDSFQNTIDAACDYDASKADVAEELVALAGAADRLDEELTAARRKCPWRGIGYRRCRAGLSRGTPRGASPGRSHRGSIRRRRSACPRGLQNAAGPAWEKLRFCESGGNYAIADSTGMFRGAYQFAISTWYGMGGVGDPADGPPSEQDYRAQILYDALGSQTLARVRPVLDRGPATRLTPCPAWSTTCLPTSH